MEAAVKRKRILAKRMLVFTTDMAHDVDYLIKRIEAEKAKSAQERKELFPEPYRDWRTNEIIE